MQKCSCCCLGLDQEDQDARLQVLRSGARPVADLRLHAETRTRLSILAPGGSGHKETYDAVIKPDRGGGATWAAAGRVIRCRVTAPDEDCLPSMVAASYQHALSALRVAKKSGKQGKILIEGFPVNLLRKSPLIRNAIREQFAAGETKIVLAVEKPEDQQDQPGDDAPLHEESFATFFPPAWEEAWPRDPAGEESDEEEEEWAAELQGEMQNPAVRKSLKALQAEFRKIRVGIEEEAEA
eukprot:g11796.t1